MSYHFAEKVIFLLNFQVVGIPHRSYFQPYIPVQVGDQNNQPLDFVVVQLHVSWRERQPRLTAVSKCQVLYCVNLAAIYDLFLADDEFDREWQKLR